MNRNEFVRALAAKTDMPIKAADELVKAYQEVLTEALASGESVSFVGFGSYQVKVREAHDMKIPSTGEVLNVPEKKRVTFKPGKKLNSAL